MKDVSVRARKRGRQWLAVFSPDEEKAVVGLATVADQQFAEFAGEVGVVGVEIERFLEKLANIRIDACNCTGNNIVQFSSVVANNALQIRPVPEIFFLAANRSEDLQAAASASAVTRRGMRIQARLNWRL